MTTPEQIVVRIVVDEPFSWYWHYTNYVFDVYMAEEGFPYHVLCKTERNLNLLAYREYEGLKLDRLLIRVQDAEIVQ